MKKMAVLGIGPKWGVVVVAYGAFSTFLSYWYAVLRIPESLGSVATITGIALLAIGIPFYALSGRTIIRGFPTGELLTTGVYGLCQPPVYGSWIVFIIPGLELLLRSWLGLTTSVVGYALLRIMAGEEEDYLQEKFGKSYLRYRRRTPFVLPIGLFRRDRP